MGILLTIYILIWPVISAAVLALICRAFLAELREARGRGKDLV